MNRLLTHKSLLVALCIVTYVGTSQNVGINATGASAHASSMLDVSSPNKGLLIPRIALTGTNDLVTIPSPAASLLIYNTATVAGVNAVSPGYYSWSGTVWLRESSYNSKSWSLLGNSLTDPTINFIGTTDAIDFVAKTNGIERLRVTSSGAVNIWSGSRYATSNNFMPAGSLTLGNTLANFGGGTNWSTNSASLLMECLDNTEIAVHDAGTRLASLLYFEGATANKIQIGRDMGFGSISTIALNGNVGIGTTSPGYKLDVADRMRVRQGANGSAGVWLYQNTPNADRAFVGMYDDNTFGIYGAGGAGWNGLSQNVNTGNVGIGLLNQTHKLQVYDPNPWGGFMLQGGTAADGVRIRMLNANNYAYDITADATNNSFGILDANAFQWRLKILSNGNVGIGTATPAFKLDVAGRIRVREGTGGYAGISFFQNTLNGDVAQITMANDNKIGIWGYLNGFGLIQDANTGCVGIRENNPIAKLHVNSSTSVFESTDASSAIISIYDNGLNGLNLYTSSNAHITYLTPPIFYFGLSVSNSNGNNPAPVYASAFLTASDKNTKHNIHDIVASEYEKYMNQIRSIESATFKYNFETYRKENHIGVIAQTLPVELQVPTVDKSGPEGKPIIGMSLADMTGLSLVGIKAIDYKQLQIDTEIESQQVLIDDLKRRIERLKHK